MNKNKTLTIYIICLFSIIILGLIMIYSASNVWAEYKYGNKYYYLIRQLIFFFLGLIAFIFSSRIKYTFWKEQANKILFVCFILLVLVLIPGIGIVRGGARSWIGFGSFSIQPSEFMKFGCIVFTSKFLSNNQGILKKNKYFYLYTLFIGIIIGLVFLQPDFGSAVVLLSSILILMFIGEFQIKNIIIGGAFLMLGLAILIIIAPYRMDRIKAFINPWNDPLGSGFQIIQSLYAISPASLFGYGLFNSKQKYFFLPEPANDFIFCIVIEELGIIGGLVLIFLFAILIQIGYRLSLNLKDSFAKYLSFGITTLLMIQVFINIAVVTGTIPTTGINLIFVSYGGSSLLINMFMTGIMVNIIKKSKEI